MHTKTRSLLLSIALCIVASLIASAAEETPVDLLGEGTALGLGPAARSAAILDAQTAIILDRLDALAPSRDFSVFESILSNAASYFKSHKLIRETKTEDSTHVEIETQLLEQKLKEEIALVVMSQNFIPPRVIILAREMLTPDASSDLTEPGVIESKLHEELKRIQFELVSPATLRAKVAPDALGALLEEDTERAAMLARDMLADIVILGTGTTQIEESANTANLKSVRGEVTLRIVRAEDGFLLDTPKAEAVVKSVNPRDAGAQAVEDACVKLLGEVKTALALGALGGAQQSGLLVTVKNLADDAQVKEFSETVKRCLGVDNAEVVYQESGLIRIRFNFDGLVSIFADCVPQFRFSFGTVYLDTAVGRDVTMHVEK